MDDSTAASFALDRDLEVRDVQALASADAVAGFFARLGYDTSARLTQTPAALGVGAESLRRKIRRVERIADQKGELLQVYLFELDSITVQATQAIARVLRDLAPNFLLVLTSDYQDLDFVLLERELPAKSTAFSQPRVLVRPRVLTVNRRNPGAVALRVLRRFAYTEADADAQYDKLRSAFAVAEWSEPYFNNRALFADYYLNVRLPESEVWREDPRPAYQQLRHLYAGARERFAGADEATALRGLVAPALEALGFRLTPGGAGGPDYTLAVDGPGEPVRVSCLAYPWDRYLDGKDEQRDARRPADNPGARVVTVLEAGPASWAILTNGKLWRLYHADAHSRATNFYEIDLEETLAVADAPGEAFRYLWLFFRADAFVPRTVYVEGESRSLSLVDEVVQESAAYAKRLGDRLKDRIFEEVFPELARGFLVHLPKVDSHAAEPGQAELDTVFRGTLTLLYRLLFLLYAEARDLLPAREQRGYWEASLSRLKTEIANQAGTIKDEAPRRIERAYASGPDNTALYDRLLELSRAVDRGSPTFNMPLYDGGLFATAPDPEDHSDEAEAARFLGRYKVPDRYFALALDRLARDIDEKRQDLVFIDYKSLGVRQLGSIYEGLLEFRLRIAPEKMAVVRGKKTEEVVSYREAIREKRTILRAGRGSSAPDKTLPRGAVYLENDQRERKASGSYYTPDHIVEYIVAEAVGPVLREHLERMRTRLRDAERAYQQARKNQAEYLRQGMAGDDPEKVANSRTWQALVDDLFEFRVLDPAMGSGHFLVEAVDFVTDTLLDFLNGFPWNPVQARLRQTRESILEEMERQVVTVDAGKLTDVNLLKRHVLKRCVYGVDLNPMAVELAKVSLWLDCFTVGAPLSFLDHHLKCGNSLVGTTVQGVEAELAAQTKGHVGDLFGGPFQGLLTATTLVEELARTPDATAEQSERSHGLFAQFEGEQKPYRSLLDLWVSRSFGNKRAHEYLTLLGAEHAEYVRTSGKSRSISPEYRRAVEMAAQLQQNRRFFHWDLEFPEAFGDVARKEWKPAAKQGFHAVVGNPPYVNAIQLSKDLGPFDKPYWRQVFQSARGTFDLYVLFLERAVSLTQADGRAGLITPNKYLSAPYGAALRAHLYATATLVRLFDVSRVHVFDDPSVYPVVSVLARPAGVPPPTFAVDRPSASGVVTTTRPRADLALLPDYIWGFLLSSGSEVLRKITEASEMLSSVLTVNASTTAAEADDFSRIITDSLRPGQDGWKIVNTGTIDPFVLLWGEVPMTHAGARYLTPWLIDNPRVVSDTRRSQYNSGKIVFAKVANRIEAAFDPTGEYASVNTNFAFTDGDAGFYYLGLLNSSLMTWVYEQYFGALRMSGGYLQFQAPQLRVIPCKRFDPASARMREIARLAREVRQSALDAKAGQRQIDEFVFSLYELDVAERAVVTGTGAAAPS